MTKKPNPKKANKPSALQRREGEAFQRLSTMMGLMQDFEAAGKRIQEILEAKGKVLQELGADQPTDEFLVSVQRVKVLLEVSELLWEGVKADYRTMLETYTKTLDHMLGGETAYVTKHDKAIEKAHQEAMTMFDGKILVDTGLKVGRIQRYRDFAEHLAEEKRHKSPPTSCGRNSREQN